MGSQKELLAATAAIVVLATGGVYLSAEPNPPAVGADVPECTPVGMTGTPNTAALGTCRESNHTHRASVDAAAKAEVRTLDADADSASVALESAEASRCGTGLMPSCYPMRGSTCIVPLDGGAYVQKDACDSESTGCTPPRPDRPGSSDGPVKT